MGAQKHEEHAYRIAGTNVASCLPTTDRDVRVGREDRRALYAGCLFSWSPCMGAARLDVRHPGACSLDGSIECRTGHTQIGRVLVHARGEHKRQKVSALVFVGDAVEETPANLYAAARRRVSCFRKATTRTRPRSFGRSPGSRRVLTAASTQAPLINCAICSELSLCTRPAGYRPCRRAAMPVPSAAAVTQVTPCLCRAPS